MTCRGIDPSVIDGDKANPHLTEVVDHVDEVSQRAAQTVELPARNQVELANGSIGHHAVECGAVILAARDAFIGIGLDNFPTTLGGDRMEVV